MLLIIESERFKIVDNKSGTYVHLEFSDKISFV